jgi:hypothetical protein
MEAAMSSTYVYARNQELPAWRGAWLDGDGDPVDLSAGTFTVKLVDAKTGTATVTKTAGITGASTLPNVTIAWASAELNIAVGTYTLHIRHRDGSGLDRDFSPGNPPTIVIAPEA